MRRVPGRLFTAAVALGFCVLGAVRFVTGAGADETNEVAAMEEAIGIPDIGEWNDAPGRTQDEVVDLFDKAIAQLEAAQ